MTGLRDFLRGFLAFFQAFPFIFRHGLYKCYFLPLILWVLLVTGLAFSLISIIEPLFYDWMQQMTGINMNAPMQTPANWWLWIPMLASLSLLLLLKILSWVAIGRIMKYFVLIIMAPIIAWLSEKTEEIVTGKQYPFSLRQILFDTARGILIVFRNFSIEFSLWGMAFVAGLMMPLLSFPILAILFLFDAYFMAFSMFDYINERQKRDIAHSIALMRKEKMRLLGLGVAYNLTAMVPLLDWVVAPMNGSVGAVLAATGTAILPSGENTANYSMLG